MHTEYFVRKHIGSCQKVKHRHRWKDNTKVELKATDYVGWKMTGNG
jgi:hypothetical protein